MERVIYEDGILLAESQQIIPFIIRTILHMSPNAVEHRFLLGIEKVLAAVCLSHCWSAHHVAERF